MFAEVELEELRVHPEGLNRVIFALAIPAIVENLLTTIVLFANTIFIGWLHDDAALAAVGLSNRFLWIANGLFRAVAVATTAMVAHFLGKKDVETAKRTAAQSLSVGVLAAMVATVIGIPLSDYLLMFMGAESEVVRLGGLYMKIILATSVLSFPMFVAGGVMRGAGDTRTPMVISLATNVWNVVVGYLLIFGPGPLRELGLVGAALATSTARALGGCLALGVLFTGRTVLRVKPRRLLSWDGHLARRIVHLALPNAGEQAVGRLGSILFMRILTALGTVALAAHQVAEQVESLSFMAGSGFTVVATTLVGQSLGASREDMAELSIRRTLMFACGVMGAMAACFALFGQQMVVIFGASPEVLNLAGRALQIGALEQVPLAIHMVLAGGLQGAGDTRTPMYVTMFGVLFFRVAVVYLFAITLGWGLAGVWLGTSVDWIGRAALMVMLFRRGRWKNVRV
jgi:putative MATE family efflux protein